LLKQLVHIFTIRLLSVKGSVSVSCVWRVLYTLLPKDYVRNGGLVSIVSLFTSCLHGTRMYYCIRDECTALQPCEGPS
jgi:hypothetical protein